MLMKYKDFKTMSNEEMKKIVGGNPINPDPCNGVRCEPWQQTYKCCSGWWPGNCQIKCEGVVDGYVCTPITCGLTEV